MQVFKYVLILKHIIHWLEDQELGQIMKLFMSFPKFVFI